MNEGKLNYPGGTVTYSIKTSEQIRIEACEQRLDEIERAVIAMYKYSFERDALMPKLAEIEPLLARMKEVKMELTQ